MQPREAFAKRLELRIRAIVRDELVSAGFVTPVDTPVDKSVDNPPPARGGIGGANLNGVTRESHSLDSPSYRTVGIAERGKPLPGDEPLFRLTEAELLRGYGLLDEYLDTYRPGQLEGPSDNLEEVDA